MQHGVGIDVAVQQCSDAVMQRYAAMLASMVSHRPVLVRRLFVEKRGRELLETGVDASPVASIGCIVPQRRLLGYMLPEQGGYGGTWREY
jgi:hypothetical protein